MTFNEKTTCVFAGFLVGYLGAAAVGCSKVATVKDSPAAASSTNAAASAMTPPLPELKAVFATVVSAVAAPAAPSGPEAVVNLRQTATNLTFSASVPATNTGSVMLRFDAVIDPSVSGYVIYFALKDTLELQRADIKKLTSVRITGLVEGAAYKIFATAYTEQGIESIPSNSIEIVCPVNAYLRLGAPVIESYGLAGVTNQIVMSTNLQNWVVLTNFVGKPGILFSFSPPNPPPHAYFRVQKAP